jgi:hypothetical protein
MPTIVNVLTPRALPAGPTVSPVVNIPGNLRRLYFYAEVLTDQAPPSCTIEMLLELSSDGGATWDVGGGITTTGGPHFERDGVTPAFPRFSGGFLPTGTGARARLTATLSEPATVGLQMTVDPVIPQARQA